MKKIIGIITIVFSLCLYAEDVNVKEANNEKTLIRLTIIMGDISEKRIIIVDSKKNKKISSIFKEVTPFENIAGKLISKVKMENDKYGFIDSDGTWIFKPIFDEARTFSKENIARVKIGKKWGYIKPDGEWLIKTKYPYVSAFKYGYAFIKDENTQLFSYINTKGKPAFKGSFSSATLFNEHNQAIVSVRKIVNNKSKFFWGQIDNKGKIIVPIMYKSKKEAMRGYIKDNNSFTIYITTITTENKKWGVLQDDGTIKKFPSDIVEPLRDSDEVYLSVDNLFTMVNKEGELVYFDEDANLAYSFRPNKNNTMSLYDKNNHEIWKSKIEKFKIDTSKFKKDKEELEKKKALSILKSSKLKWEKPLDKTCISYNGKIEKSVCLANWSNAIKICKDENKRLPTIEELEGMIMGCGGDITDDIGVKKRNKTNNRYQACYKKNHFTSGIYWSSSYDIDFAHYKWLVEFLDGSVGANIAQSQYGVQCVK